MNRVDERGYSITGAEPAALLAFERALVAFQSWHTGADVQVALALQEAPCFVMAHVLQAYLLLCSRDPRRVRSARPALAHAVGLPANERERLHVAALAATLGDDYECAKARLSELLRLYPRDVLALQVAHAFDYVTGDVASLRDRVAALLPAWSPDLPGYHAVLAMHAFGLEECGEYERAETVARTALALNAFDARAHHVMAHIFEMTKDFEAGVCWMNAHVACWGVDTVVATHCWWHLALYHIERDQPDNALALYDHRIRDGYSHEIADLIDAAALLWRVLLRGGDAGVRWTELSAAWAPRIVDCFCSFNDLHAMLAFVGARDWDRAQRLERVLIQAQSLPTRHGKTTRQLGLPACRALIAFGRGNYNLAVALLASLPPLVYRLGGSHAQRDVLHMTLLQAVGYIRRPSRRIGVELRRAFLRLRKTAHRVSPDIGAFSNPSEDGTDRDLLLATLTIVSEERKRDGGAILGAHGRADCGSADLGTACPDPRRPLVEARRHPWPSCCSERPPLLRRVDAAHADAVLPSGVAEQGEGVAVRDPNDPAAKGFACRWCRIDRQGEGEDSGDDGRAGHGQGRS